MARYRHEAVVRWADLDALGHVNNVAYLVLLQEARVAMYGEVFGSIDWQDTGVVVARQEIDYLVPLHFRTEPIPVELWVEHVGAASYRLGYEVRDADRLYARASSVMVKWNRADGRPARLDEGERALLESLRDEAGS